MSHPFRFTFLLKQHTPLIHFQADQKGAGLRATELKPKLDKFLFAHCFKDKAEYKDFQVPKGTNTEARDALNYKVTVKHTRTKPITGPEVDKNPLYFGNMGKMEYEKKHFTFNPDNIEVTIFSYKTELLERIKENLCAFFAVTNFGTRQNKGFGSYYISPDWAEYFENIEKNLPPGTSYLETGSTDDNVIYALIDTYYKRLKPGINLNFRPPCDEKKYHKSFLYRYLDDKDNKMDYTWEKRRLKEIFFHLKPDPTKKEPKFARALLGLPGSYTFKRTEEPCNPGKRTTVKHNSEIQVKSKTVERIQSPITFKVIKYETYTRIYILVFKTDQSLFENDRAFEFTLTSKDGTKSGTLSIPDSDIDVENLLRQYHRHLPETLTFQYKRYDPERKKMVPAGHTTATITQLGEKSK